MSVRERKDADLCDVSLAQGVLMEEGLQRQSEQSKALLPDCQEDRNKTGKKNSAVHAA